MDTTGDYVLLIGQPREMFWPLQHWLKSFSLPLRSLSTVEQALAALPQRPPCLVILAASQTQPSAALVRCLRETIKPAQVTIVALTEIHNPCWSCPEDHPGLDGVLVKPLSADILNSVVASALAKTGFNPMVNFHPALG
jgi:DNA-binding NarL/FixJ family response regulator